MYMFVGIIRRNVFMYLFVESSRIIRRYVFVCRDMYLFVELSRIIRRNVFMYLFVEICICL